MSDAQHAPSSGPAAAAGPAGDLLRIRDELEIRNVLARVAHLSDMGDLEEHGAQFTEDAVWEMPGVSVKRGRAEIQAAGAARRAEGATGPGSHTRHLIDTTSVTVRGDTAVAESCWRFYAATATAPRLRLMGHYRDVFRRTCGGWRLAHRQITVG